MEGLEEKIGRLKGRKVLVLGDLILDKYIFGRVERLSPEAPVPVLSVESEEYRLGGAGNAAHNIAALEGKALVVGLVGEDANGQTMLDELKAKGIGAEGVRKTKEMPTILKTRVMEKQQFVRIDHEKKAIISREMEDKLIEATKKGLAGAECLLVSDYGKGCVTERVFKEAAEAARALGLPIVVDPKPRYNNFYHNVTLVTPNLKEVRELALIPMHEEVNVLEAGRLLKRKLNSDLLITQGSQGMHLFEGEKAIHFPAKAREVFDVSGAGDTVSGTVALALAAKLGLQEACYLANQAAGIVVGKKGTATVSFDELARELEKGRNGSRAAFVEKFMEEQNGRHESLRRLAPQIERFAGELVQAFKDGKKVLVCGNGGSASDAQHFQAELIGRFKKDRKGLPCIALTQHPSLLTALANDFGFEEVFAKQVEALGQAGDVLVALSTSGNSPNIIQALKKAREMGLKTIGLSGNQGGRMNEWTDLNLVVEDNFSARIQESHITIIHLVSEMVEKAVYPDV